VDYEVRPHMAALWPERSDDHQLSRIANADDHADNPFRAHASLFLEPSSTERELSSKFSAAMANVVHRISWRLARGDSI
jgi:hypothetical protein